MKVYPGTRVKRDNPWPDPVVTVNGKELNNPDPDSGPFEWGYPGGGPKNLALAILADCLRDKELVQHLYRPFTEHVIAVLPREGWTLTENQVYAAIAQIEPR